jgi:hypothetical protein
LLAAAALSSPTRALVGSAITALGEDVGVLDAALDTGIL